MRAAQLGSQAASQEVRACVAGCDHVTLWSFLVLLGLSEAALASLPSPPRLARLAILATLSRGLSSSLASLSMNTPIRKMSGRDDAESLRLRNERKRAELLCRRR